MRLLAIPVALTLVLVAPGAGAQDPTRSSLGSGNYPTPTLHGELKLSLLDSIAMGLENNLRIEIERYEPLIASEDHRGAWGGYDPVWDAELGYSDIEDPTANVLFGQPVVQNKLFDGFTTIGGLVPWLGASYEMGLSGRDARTNSTINVLSPELRSEVNFALTVPLMRGLIWNEPWTLVKTTGVLEISAREDFRRQVMNIVQAIEDGYWALIADEERVRVAEKSVETAQALLEQVTTQYEVGVVSKVEIAEAEAGLADRDFNLIVARNQYQTTMDDFIDLVLGPNLKPDSRIQIEPTDRPDEYIPYEIDAEEATQVAFQRRPELVIAQQEIERLEINLRFAKNQRLPRLDAVLAYGNRGISGSQNPEFDPCRFAPDVPPCDPDAFDLTIGGFGKTFETPGDFFTSDAARQLSARAVVSIPFPNTTARANVSKAQLQLRRASVRARRVEQDIILEVREAVRNIASAQEGIEAAQRGTVAAEEQLRAERIRLEYGESTPFDVLQREEDLVRAESQEIGAFQTYRTAVTGLDRAQGTILRNRNVRIEEAARLR